MSYKSALLIVDVQADMFSYPEMPVYQGEELLKNIKKLIHQARVANIPVIYIQHCEDENSPMAKGKPGWEVHPDIAPLEKDITVYKETPSAFYNTNLHEILTSAGINKLVVTGLQTEYCVDSTVRHAFFLGYDVVLVKDANSTYNNSLMAASQIIEHHHGIINGRFAKVLLTDEVAF